MLKLSDDAFGPSVVFLSEDPLGQLEPELGFKRDYTYVENVPIMFVDPLGLYRTGACGTRFVSLGGGANHFGRIGTAVSNAVGNNLVGFCARCPAPKVVTSARIIPTPPVSSSGVSAMSVQPTGVAPGVDSLRQQCGCDGAGETFIYANVRTSLAWTPSMLKSMSVFYGLEYECQEPTCRPKQLP